MKNEEVVEWLRLRRHSRIWQWVGGGIGILICAATVVSIIGAAVCGAAVFSYGAGKIYQGSRMRFAYYRNMKVMK